MPLYFAYGSNMDTDYLKTRRGLEAIGNPLFTAELASFGLAFTRYSRLQNGGVADIVADTGKTVWGAVFELTDDQLNALDALEGAKADPPAYRRRTVTVTAHTQDGAAVHLQDNTVIENDRP